VAFFGVVKDGEAQGETARLYDEIRPAYKGRVPEFFQAQGRLPRVLAAQLPFFGNILAEGALPKVLKEQIALVVSGINHSSYCIALHSDFLHQLNVPKALGRKLALHYPDAPGTEAEQALYRFADKLTRQPGEIAESDVTELRAHGWTDEQLREAVLVVAALNFANRVSAGLGLVADF